MLFFTESICVVIIVAYKDTHYSSLFKGFYSHNTLVYLAFVMFSTVVFSVTLCMGFASLFSVRD